MGITKEAFLAALDREADRRRQERARQRKAARIDWNNYRIEIFNRTVAQRKRWCR